MEDKGTEPVKEERTFRKARKHPVLKAVLFTFLGLWLLVTIVLQIALNSTVLTKIINSFSSEYVDGSLAFSNVKASMFRNFPNLNITIDNVSLTYPHDRFAAYDSLTSLGDSLQNLGRAKTADTLAHFDKLDVSVNYLTPVFGKIRIRKAILEHPRIFARQYDSTKANWMMFKVQQSNKENTSAVKIPSISARKIRLAGRPFAVYSNPSDTLFGVIVLKQIEAGGHYKAKRHKLNNISLNIDSLFVAGRLPADTLALALDNLKVNERGKHFAVEMKSKVFLALKSTGRMAIPIDIKGKVKPELKKKTIEVKDLKASIATLDIKADGLADYSKESIYLRADASIDKEPVSEITDYFGANFPMLKKLHTDAKISMDAHCDGYYNPEKHMIPKLTAHLEVPRSEVRWDGIEGKGQFDLEATAASKGDRLSADIPDLCLLFDGLKIRLDGKTSDLLAEDPSFHINSDIHASIDSLSSLIPEDLDITAGGNLDGSLKGDFLLSQLSPYNFSGIDVTGALTSDGIRIDDPKDTLRAFLGSTSIKLGTFEDEDRDEHSASVKWKNGPVGITASIDSLYAEYGASTFFRGTGIRLIAHNLEETLSEKPERHPLVGHLLISSIGMMDLDSCFVGIKESSNTFKLAQVQKGTQTIPFLNLTSSVKGVSVRESVNRYSVHGVTLTAAAHPGSTEDNVRRKHLLDSLQRVYPGVKRDSLFKKAFRMRMGALPDFLSEKDFEKKDIDIRLSESMAKYIKDWDISGTVKLNDAAVITPYYPLENKISDLRGKFTNDRLDLANATVTSGSSDVSASGLLTGLKRALTGKGRLDLNLDLTSNLIDVNEILRAVNAGSKFVPPAKNEALAGINDKEYLDKVQKKTLAADTVAESSLIVLPANLNAKVSIQANTVKYSGLETSWVSSNLEMKERCLQATNTLATTNMGNAYLEGFYSTRTKKDLKAGFDLTLSDITAEKVIQLFPAVDSILPMLQAFKGLLDCELAATASLDTSMNIIMPTLNGIMKIDGKNLSLAESDDLNKLRRTLMFRDKDSSNIADMSVRGIIKDNQLEIFPFILKIDRYTIAASGLQQFDQQFKYHVSALHSPIPFRFGVNLKGNFDDWKWKLARAKYKSKKIPLFDDQVDGLRFNLINAIHNIFARGVEQAIKQNEKSQEAIETKKDELGYTDAQADSLSSSELSTLKTLGNMATGIFTPKAAADTLVAAPAVPKSAADRPKKKK